ncbi:MAG: acyltransferase family protein [Alsobacter sp.]
MSEVRSTGQGPGAVREGPPQRFEILDIAKGLCIILVVYGHIARGMINPDTPWLQFVDVLIYTFHMPVFFLISGFLAARPVPSEKTLLKLWSLAYLYVVWSLITVLAKVLLSMVGTVNTPSTFQDLIRIGYAPIGTLWFLYALIIVQALAPLARHTPMLALALSLLVDGLATALRNPGIRILADTAFHAPYFFAGLAMGAGALPWPWQPRWARPTMAAAAGALLVGGSLVVTATGGRPVSFVTVPLSMLGIGLVFRASRPLVGRAAGDHFAWLGRNSLSIYLIHVLVLPVIPRLAGLLGLRDSAAFQLPLGTLLGVYGSLACALALSRLGLSDMLGLDGRLPEPLLRRFRAFQTAAGGERPTSPR